MAAHGMAAQRLASPTATPVARRIERADIVVAAALVVVAIVVRGGALPVDGLYRDDAWVVMSVVHGSPTELLWVGWAHPGFTAILMAWSALVGNDAVRFAYPVFVAGALAPGLLFLALRRFGHARAIAAVLAAALLATNAHIEYSGRVKPYVIDALVVLGLAVVLPRLDRATWTWPIALGWVAGALALSSLSSFALVAAAVAALVLLAGSGADRAMRVAAVGVQGLASLAYIASTRDLYNLDAVEDFWKTRNDAFLEFTWNPFGLAADILQHARRVTEVFPGGPDPLPLLWVGAAVVGLVVALTHTRDRVRVRFLVLVLLAAIAGAFVHVLPFGATNGGAVADGGRVSLWLIPPVAVGLAVALQFPRSRAQSVWPRVRTGMDIALYMIAAGVVVAALAGTRVTYPVEGSSAAVEFIESELGPCPAPGACPDVVLLLPVSRWEYAASSRLDIELAKEPQLMTGFDAEPKDPRVHVLRTVTAAEVDRAVDGAERVFTYAAILAFSDFAPVQKALEANGYVEEAGKLFGGNADASVRVWRR
jgi:hypothetical protein